MPTISANVSKKELDAIREYANACGETMSNLIRKSILTDATLMNFYNDSSEFIYGISIPDSLDANDETHILLNTCNKIRRILNLQEYDYI